MKVSQVASLEKRENSNTDDSLHLHNKYKALNSEENTNNDSVDYTASDSSGDTVAGCCKQTLHLCLVKSGCKRSDLAKELRDVNKNTPLSLNLKVNF